LAGGKVGFRNTSIFGKAGLKSTGKSDSQKSADTNPLCPKCGSKKLWRDGLRYPMFGDQIQRWLCRDCGLRFSDARDVERAKEAFKQVEKIESKSLKSGNDTLSTCQICVKETKNLVAEQKQMEVPRRTEVDLKGAVVDFLWQLKRENYSEDTIAAYGYNLKMLVDLGINLFDPQNFIDKMAELTKTDTRKYNLRKAYKCFLNHHKIEAKLPKYKVTRPLPYVPPTAFLDQLIACANGQMSVLLQVLKETGARPGEALRIEWDDIDTEQRKINISHPEKGCNPRILPISLNLINSMLGLPRIKQNFIFNYKSKSYAGKTFRLMRARAIQKLGNKELRKIDFYTFRYWRATMEYRKYRDFGSVMVLLGHKSLRYVLLYAQLSKNYEHGGDGYIVREANTKAQAKTLLEDGFEYVMDKDGVSLFRKLK
jgi:integrase